MTTRPAPSAALLAVFLLAGRVPGATNGFAFLQIQPDSRVAATAGSSLAGASGVGALMLNPAATAGQARNTAQFLWLDHIQDINYLNTSVCLVPAAPWVVSAGFSHLGYGSMDGRDTQGQPTGEFDSSDNLVFAGVARELGPVLVGGTLKLGWSTLDEAGASLLVCDLGLQGELGAGFRGGVSLRNAGRVLSEFGSSDTPLPRTVSAGVSRTLAHLPFTWSLAWQQERDQDSEVLLGGEFLIANRWHLGLGYNFGLGGDRLANISGETTRGLSAGVGGRIVEEVTFHWSWSSFGELGALNRFTLSRPFP